MKIVFITARHTWGWTLRLGIVLLLVVALFISLSRLLLPQLATYRAQLEQGIGDYLHLPVRIQGLEAAWVGWGPAIRVDGFSLHHPESGSPIASFTQALVSLDLARSLMAGRPMLSNIRLEGLRLTLKQDADGSLRLISQNGGGESVQLQDLATWLLDVQSLDLSSGEVWVLDAHGDRPPLIFRNLHLSLRADGQSHHLGLTLNPPPSLGRHLRVAVDLQGNADNPADWRATFYLQGDKLELAGWPVPVVHAGGQVSLEIWGDWQGQQPVKAIGRARFQDLAPADATSKGGAVMRLPPLAAEFEWRRTAVGWRWQSAWARRDIPYGAVKHSRLDLTLESQAGRPPRLQGQATDLRLQDLAVVAVPWLNKAQRTWLGGLWPVGAVSELLFEADLDQDAPRYALAARVSEVAIRDWGYIPQIEGLEASLFLDQDGGRLDLDGRKVQTDVGALLRGPVAFDRLIGAIQWRHETTGLRLESSGLTVANADLQARLQGTATLFADATSPLLDLRVDYYDLDVGQASAYLPAAIMRPKLVEWLDRALVSGRVPEGRLIFKGHLADFPFNQKEGVFETHFRVRDTILDYTKAWPRLEALEAEVIFHNDSFQIEAVAGKLFDVDLKRVHGQIDNIPHGPLQIKGYARGPGAGIVRFLRESPLAERLGHYVADMQVEGDNTLNFDLTIPFDDTPIQVRGIVGFDKGTLILPAWDVSLERIEGNLGFSEHGLMAQTLELLFRGEPARLDIDTRTREDGRGETHFRMRGRLSADALLSRYAAEVSPYLDGKAYWDIILVIPAARPDGAAGLDLSLTSDLEGMEVSLPYPFGKSPADKRTFAANVKEGETGAVQVSLDYDADIHAVMELAGSPGQLQLSRGELRIHSGRASLPKAAGLNVVARLSHFEWPMLGGIAQTNGGFPWLATIDAHLGELVVAGQHFPQVRLQVQNRNKAVAVELSGETINGRAYIPAAPSPQAPISIELRRLALHCNEKVNGSEKVARDATEALDPRELPPLRVTVENLLLDDHLLGSLRLYALPDAQGLRLVALELQHAGLHRITASGDWLMMDEGQLSRLQASFHSQELARSLQAFGYALGLERGETKAELTASWPAPFPAFSTALLEGRLSLQVGRGQLLDVRPGVGRVVGLLNLHSLSRRLALDFSDLFQKGLGFDRIDGTFAFDNGHAYTNDFTLEGPSARINVSGRIGIEDQDYDQIVTVTPQLSSTLPIAGAIAGGPVVGAALFIAERLFRREIEQVARYQYSVTGSWDNPEVERIVRPARSAAPSTHELR